MTASSTQGRQAAKTQRRASFETAILRLQKRKLRVTIAAVAKEAGVTPALLHNTYPDVAEKIRSIYGRGTRAQRDAKHEEVIRLRAANRKLHEAKEQSEADVRRLASMLEGMRFELARLQAIAAGRVADLSVAKRGGS